MPSPFPHSELSFTRIIIWNSQELLFFLLTPHSCFHLEPFLNRCSDIWTGALSARRNYLVIPKKLLEQAGDYSHHYQETWNLHKGILAVLNSVRTSLRTSPREKTWGSWSFVKIGRDQNNIKHFLIYILLSQTLHIENCFIVQ